MCANSFGTMVGTPTVFLTEMPQSPDNCIALIAHGGPPAQGPNRRSALQILVRNTSNLTALTKASSLFQLFDDKWCPLGAAYPGRFTADHEPGLHTQDESGHSLYSLNFTFHSVL